MISFLLLFLALGRLYRDMLKQPETRALLFAAMVVLLVGVVFYTQVEGWRLLDALYFCVVTLGTVGYGDMAPKTDLGKLFTIFYITLGLGVIGGFFATLGKMIQLKGLFAREREALTPQAEPGNDAKEQGDTATAPAPNKQ